MARKRKKRMYQEEGIISPEELTLGQKIQNLLGRSRFDMYDPRVSEQGEESKIVGTTTARKDADVLGLLTPITSKIKAKGSKGKIKTKYDRFGNLKKKVVTKGGKRVVHKPKRDERESMANVFRNMQNESPETQAWLMDVLPELFE